MTEWLTAAQALPLGGSRKIPHSCGTSPAMHINHKESGWSCFCHRCGHEEFVPRPAPTLAERAALREAARLADTLMVGSAQLPTPRVDDPWQWPSEARLWLFKAGFTTDAIKAAGFYFHPPTRRVVIPLRSQGGGMYWQARNVMGDGPKYLSARTKPANYFPVIGTGPVTVLTEDALSAIKVGQVCSAVPLLGTTLPDSYILPLSNRRVVVWLDNDAGPRNWGQIKARAVLDRLAMFGVHADNLVTERDPKMYCLAEIRQHLLPFGV